MKEPDLKQKTWCRAAALGCLWASVEIVLGSFLLNLRIPFGSNLLTGFGIVLLIAGIHRWPTPGLCWRAGLICACMKAISPSVVILPPMISIFMQGLLLELAIRLLGRTRVAFVLGGMMAMSWNLVQKLANYIILYGEKIITVYTQLVQVAQQQLGLKGLSGWQPLLLLLAVQATLGAAAAGLGIAAGRKALTLPAGAADLSVRQILQLNRQPAHSEPVPSLGWLAFNAASLVLVLILLGASSWPAWGFVGGALLLIWPLRYGRALRPLAKPAFWAFSLILTGLSGYLLFALKEAGHAWQQGILAGMGMSLRAAILIVGFSTIGSELRHVRIRKLLDRPRWRPILTAIEAALAILPQVIAHLPPPRRILRSPSLVLQEMLAQTDYWMRRIELQQRRRAGIIILSGNVRDGKSSYLLRLSRLLESSRVSLAGIYSPSVRQEQDHVGYDLIDARTGRRHPLCRTTGRAGMPQVGPYYFLPEGLEFGRQALDLDRARETDLMIVDEIGPWELSGQGWAEPVARLILNSDVPMIWAVRDKLVEKAIEQWALTRPEVIRVDQTPLEEALKRVMETVTEGKKPVSVSNSQPSGGSSGRVTNGMGS